MFVSYGGNIGDQGSRSRDGQLSTVRGTPIGTQPCLIETCMLFTETLEMLFDDSGGWKPGYCLRVRFYSALLEFTETATQTRHVSSCHLHLYSDQSSVKFDNASITSTSYNVNVSGLRSRRIRWKMRGRINEPCSMDIPEYKHMSTGTTGLIHAEPMTLPQSANLVLMHGSTHSLLNSSLVVLIVEVI